MEERGAFISMYFLVIISDSRSWMKRGGGPGSAKLRSTRLDGPNFLTWSIVGRAVMGLNTEMLYNLLYYM
jgi:hypothetical protein